VNVKTPKQDNGAPVIAEAAVHNAIAEQVAEDSRGFAIPRPEMRPALIHLAGTAPLIMHRWSEKAIKALEDSQTGKAKAQRTAKSPREEAYSAAYIIPGKEKASDGPGKFYFPAEAFKHAYLYGISQLNDTKKFPKTRATGWVFIDGDPIIGFASMEMRTDVGRDPVQMVYRLQFNEWTAPVNITFNANTITIEQVAALFDLGGVGGIGEWRPSAPKNKSGNYGRFRVTGVES
jgi:hypothetical protein